MKKTIIAILLFSLIVLAMGLFSYAADEPLRVVMDDNYPPYAFRNDDGELVGISIDLWNLFSEKTGREIEITGIDWGMAQEKMKTGEFDVIDTIFKNETREKIYDFTQPYTQIDTSLYFHKNITGIKDIESARGFSIATKRGDYSIEILNENGLDSIVMYDSYEEIIEIAEDGEIVMFIMDDLPAQYFLYKKGLQNEFRYTEPLYSNQFYRAVKKGNPKLLTYLNFGFNQIKDSEKKEIYEAWQGNKPGISEEAERILWRWAGGLLSLLFLTSVISLYSRRQVKEKTKELAGALHENRKLAERLETIIYSIPDMMFIVDRKGVFAEDMIEADKATKFMGRNFGGKSIEEIFPPGLAKGYRQGLERFVETGVTRTFECDLMEMGLDLQYDLRLTWINEDLILVMTRDITERNVSNKKLYELGIMDSLTGVYNRNFFERELSNIGKEKGNFAIMVCDVDALKLFNDIMGHISGDEYLRTVAGVMKKNMPEEAVLARVGGDEFAVIFKNTTLTELEKIKQSIKIDLIKVGGDYQFVPIGLSIGYALRNLNGADIRELYRSADDEMYREKTNHRYTRSSGDISLLTKMLEARNYETEAHANRLEKYCNAIGTKLKFPESKMNSLSLFAKFHDIGKIGIKDSILLKPGKLTSDEFEEMKKHSEIGYRIANSLPDINHIAELIHMHHEWYDGSGYPFGIEKEEIPIECRILAVADAYDAITSDRPYREALGKEFAINELKSCSGKQFDSNIVDLFIEMLKNEDMDED